MDRVGFVVGVPSVSGYTTQNPQTQNHGGQGEQKGHCLLVVVVSSFSCVFSPLFRESKIEECLPFVINQ